MADKHVAIISGGLGDIGRAIAMQLAGLGADVALGDIRESSDADEVLDAIRGKDRRARYDRVDVSDAAAVQAWLRAVEEDLGMPDWIVPNAAVVALQDLDTVTPEVWEREVGINLHGMFYLAQAAAGIETPPPRHIGDRYPLSARRMDSCSNRIHRGYLKPVAIPGYLDRVPTKSVVVIVRYVSLSYICNCSSAVM